MNTLWRMVGIPAFSIAGLLVPVVSSAGAVTDHAAASQLIEGTAVCSSGRPVAGVWVADTAGGSGFAGWTAEALPNVAQFHQAVVPGGSVSVQVGCGKQGANGWVSNNQTAYIPVGSGTVVLNTVCSDGSTSGTGLRCSFPPRGLTQGSNPGVAGNCTWEAAQLMDQAIGVYPGWGGNALVWASNAASTGWMTSSVPMVNSIFVFQPNHGTPASAGHVGWVTSVSPDGRTFYATEMNVSNLGVVVRGRPETYDFTTRFILIPPSPPVG